MRAETAKVSRARSGCRTVPAVRRRILPFAPWPRRQCCSGQHPRLSTLVLPEAKYLASFGWVAAPFGLTERYCYAGLPKGVRHRRGAIDDEREGKAVRGGH